MKKRTLAKLGGFAVAAATTAALVGFAANGTGAYFTASTDGNLNVSTGAVTITTDPINALDFTGLLPGNYKTETFQYNVNGGTGPEDVYLEIPGDDALQHIPENGPVPLGRYGHFAVSGPNGSFSSFNLAADPGDVHGETDNNPADCQVDQYGRSLGGGQQTAATSTSDNTDGYCPAPQFILLGYDVVPGSANQTASITFGFTGLLENGPSNLEENSSVSQLPIRVVAVQHGIFPNDPLNSPFS